MPLLALPDELHLEIASYLDPYSTLRLSKASAKFFHLLRKPDALAEILFFLEVNEDHFFDNRHKDLFPCYKCLKALGRKEFFLGEKELLYGKRGRNYNNFGDVWQPAFCLGGNECEGRVCKKCDKEHGGAFARSAEEILEIEEKELISLATDLYSTFKSYAQT
ncbi:hypothetical protein GJ744_009846 [Endocarpon pusillum]|uniref:F-box domain-containing protein n=1 Tax=Endocarpon pusillum TaxID=364733 RepID=A0A8H7AYF4_9EURO|nr:hypothetical protein GJ744_009846 [Endocarpon pusillum]